MLAVEGLLVAAAKRIEDIEATRRLELLIDGVVDYAIYLIGTNGDVLSWNTGARRLKGHLVEAAPTGRFAGNVGISLSYIVNWIYCKLPAPGVAARQGSRNDTSKARERI